MRIGQRIRQFREAKGYKVKPFADIIGVSQGSLSDIENEKTSPSAKTLASLVRNTDVNPEWLLAGTGEMIAGRYRLPIKAIYDRLKEALGIEKDSDLAQRLGTSEDALYMAEVGNEMPLDRISALSEKEGLDLAWILTGKRTMPTEGNKPVHVYTLAGAGAPQVLTEYEPIETIILPAEFNGPNIVAVKVRGTSMEPTIWDGAIVGINKADRQLISGEIYGLWMPYEGGVIKRLYAEFDKVRVKSDNPSVPDIVLPAKELDEHFLQGRVKWVLQWKRNGGVK